MSHVIAFPKKQKPAEPQHQGSVDYHAGIIAELPLADRRRVIAALIRRAGVE